MMEIEEIKALLTISEPFLAFESAELDVLQQHGEVKEFSPGKIMYMKGQQSNDTFCMILSGQVDIVATGGRILKSMGETEVLGEVALSNPHHIRTVNVIVKEPTQVLEWNVNHIKDKIPGLWKKLLKLAWKNIANYYEE
jgi:signal-transduction protein with cAMP-binding, CBS, and nucleotidyltransferase domain